MLITTLQKILKMWVNFIIQILMEQNSLAKYVTANVIQQ